MKRSSAPLYRLDLFAPWATLGTDAGAVIAMRLAWMPWLLATNPPAADKEARLMVSEKQAAASETVMALWQAPVRFWSDVFRSGLATTPDAAAASALKAANRRLAAPSSRRVKANRRRLSQP